MPRNLTACLVIALVIQGGSSLLFSQNAAGSSSPPETKADNQLPGSPRSPGFQERYPRYQLLPGDTMDLVFEFSPEFNQTVTIQPDGYISLRGVGDVHVSSETLPELVTALENAYSKILNKPAISVLMKDFEKPYFIVNGQVGHPGKYTLHGEMTVTEALAQAGGLTEKSKHSQVVLFRRVSSQWTEAKLLNVKEMLNNRNLSEDFVLRPGDMIYVPQNTYSKIERYLPTTSMNTYLAPGVF
jgi:protein involved in polysaccharide export with SLBB domain